MKVKTHATNDHDRLAEYVEHFFARHEKTEWPTVRRAARSLGWTQTRTVEAVDGDPSTRLFTSSFFFDEPSVGEHFIEAY